MSSPYRSAQIEAPTSFALTAALNVAWCAVGLRAVAALCEAFATQRSSFERPALALVLGATGAVAVAAARLARVHPERSGRALAMAALVSALVSVLGWQPLVGFTDGYGPGLSSLGEWGSIVFSASSWAGAGLLLVVSLIAPSSRATARRDAAEREDSAVARAAQAQSLRAFSSSALGVVFSMVLSILTALAVEQTGLHWHWSSAVRAIGMVSSALFGVRALRAAWRLHGWAPSVLSTSVGFSLWIAAVVGAAFVLREWSAVLWSNLGRARSRAAVVDSSVVEQAAVNRLVVGSSSPGRAGGFGAIFLSSPTTARVGKQKPPRSDPRGLRRFSPELRAFRALRVLRRRSRACSQRAPSELDERRVGQLSRSLSCPVGREKPRGV
jgi:hypothetical protein